MHNTSESTNLWRFSIHPNKITIENQEVISEQSVALIVNQEPWLTFICSPINLDALALGFLWDEGVIDNIREIEDLLIQPDCSSISVTISKAVKKPKTWHRTSTGFAMPQTDHPTSSEDGFTIKSESLISLFEAFISKQAMHKSIGGYHSAALSNGKEINISVEDVGRHNCLDKISGLYLLGKMAFLPRMVLLTGRISSEMIHKALKLNISLIVSRTTPTINALKIAKAHKITLVGYLRGNSFNVYSHPERVVL